MSRTRSPLNTRLFFALIGMGLVGLACGPLDLARDILSRLPTPTITPSSEEHFSQVWYVAVDGDDSNTCTRRAEACRTLNEVLSRATDDDVINIGPGTFTEPVRVGKMFFVQDLDVSIRGTGQSATILESDGTGTVLLLAGDSRVTISNLTLQNGGGDAPGNCLSLRGTSSATVRDVTIQNCTKIGVEHLSGQPLRLIDVTVQGSQPDPELGAGYGGIGVMSAGNIVIEGGQVIDNAGNGILAYGPVEIHRTHIARNGLEGVTLSAEGSLQDVIIEGNTIDPAIGAFHSGLWLQPGADVLVVNSQILRNDNGVKVEDGAALETRGSLIEAHPRTGLIIAAGAQATLQGTTIRDNGSLYAGTSIPGGIENEGRLTIRESTIATNRNGGIGNMGTSADLSLIDSTVEGNEGNLASVYNNLATALIEGSTITGDDNIEGAVSNRGTMTVRNSTISGNHGIGLEAGAGIALSVFYTTITGNGEIGLNAHRGGEVVTLIASSLIAGNGGRSDCLFGSVFIAPATSGGNIDSDGSCGFARTESLAAIALGPLADNGGATQTHALMDGSVALDAASGDCPATDQRGTARPQGLRCDVGAYEVGAVAMSATGAPALATVTPTPATGEPTTLEDTLCWKGPGPLYEVVSSLKAGTPVDLRGVGLGGGWLVIDNPLYPGVNCWLPQDKLQVDPTLDLTALPLFDIPPLPTATPPPGCLYQGPNDPQAICYPYDQCPVPFDQSQGACTP